MMAFSKHRGDQKPKFPPGRKTRDLELKPEPKMAVSKHDPYGVNRHNTEARAWKSELGKRIQETGKIYEQTAGNKSVGASFARGAAVMREDSAAGRMEYHQRAAKTGETFKKNVPNMLDKKVSNRKRPSKRGM